MRRREYIWLKYRMPLHVYEAIKKQAKEFKSNKSNKKKEGLY